MKEIERKKAKEKVKTNRNRYKHLDSEIKKDIKGKHKIEKEKMIKKSKSMAAKEIHIIYK